MSRIPPLYTFPFREFWDLREFTMKFAAASAKPQAMHEEIQQQMRDVCQPRGYDEFYRVTTERGFTKITIPKTKSAG